MSHGPLVIDDESFIKPFLILCNHAPLRKRVTDRITSMESSIKLFLRDLRTGWMKNEPVRESLPGLLASVISIWYHFLKISNFSRSLTYIMKNNVYFHECIVRRKTGSWILNRKLKVLPFRSDESFPERSSGPNSMTILSSKGSSVKSSLLIGWENFKKVDVLEEKIILMSHEKSSFAPRC